MNKKDLLVKIHGYIASDGGIYNRKCKDFHGGKIRIRTKLRTKFYNTEKVLIADFIKIMAMPGRRLMLKVASVTSLTASATSSVEAFASWARVSVRTALSRSQRVARKSADMSRVAQASRAIMPRSFPSRYR